MDVATLELDRTKARKLAAEYVRSVRARHGKELDEVQRRLDAEDRALLAGYRAIARGQQVLHLGQVISKGGIFDNGLPRLAACRSSAMWCYVSRRDTGSVNFSEYSGSWADSRRFAGDINLPAGTLPNPSSWSWNDWNRRYRAHVPSVPAPLRPAHHLRNYVTLFEVPQWSLSPTPPGDPLLLKQLHGALYAVVAQWDLTPLEQAVLGGRM